MSWGGTGCQAKEFEPDSESTGEARRSLRKESAVIPFAFYEDHAWLAH